MREASNQSLGLVAQAKQAGQDALASLDAAAWRRLTTTWCSKRKGSNLVFLSRDQLCLEDIYIYMMLNGWVVNGVNM